ncbi:DUF427 domain-containing protein [Rhodococcus sp. SORGH_AS_0303]|uniref:DUF427 domain-containing protein n=1 Tax=Rhodococcus sp. SORGH_AS_0303 TaxID=3041753 RepID=UPI002781911A|nr:DUF427 domain-containing protein [Rhodococcus sp. SORGH_AS_0303]MDQ1202895.1 uncharacterized protein (DUF427 family) [Rhodococcus sp. SORGH_AS_0303]
MASRLPYGVTPEQPGEGQESVWDYPRPPALEASTKHLVVRFGDAIVADSHAAHRVLETSHPPTWYIPRADVDESRLRRSSARSTMCEWKGSATYWDIVGDDGAVLEAGGWSYENPTPSFAPIAGALSFSPVSLTCELDGEVARPQEGGFYAGWITRDVVGPFKGIAGSWGW